MPVISFKVGDEEHAAVQRVAEAQGQSPGSLCRSLALSGIGALTSRPRVSRQIANGDLLRKILGELGRQGSLLNQIARRANAGADATVIAPDLMSMRGTFETTLKALTSALGVEKDP